jgi:hypothetical protein
MFRSGMLNNLSRLSLDDLIENVQQYLVLHYSILLFALISSRCCKLTLTRRITALGGLGSNQEDLSISLNQVCYLEVLHSFHLLQACLQTHKHRASSRATAMSTSFLVFLRSCTVVAHTVRAIHRSSTA